MLPREKPHACVAHAALTLVLCIPNRIAARSLPTRHLSAVTERAVPLLGYLEKVIYPRWPSLLAVSGHFVGISVILLSTRLPLTPIPLSNVVPALVIVVIVVISVASLEEDGLALDLWLLRETVPGAKWISHFW